MYRIRGIGTVLLLLLVFGSQKTWAAQAVVSHAVFYKVSPLGKDSVTIEVYWQIDAASLHYRRGANGLVSAAVHTEISITDESGNPIVLDKFLYGTRPLPDSLALLNPIAELRRYAIDPRKVTVAFTLSEDGFPKADFHWNETIDASIPQRPWYSSIQLLDTVYESSVRSSFLKDGLMQIPHFLPFYDEGQHRVTFTAQLYETNKLPASAYPLVQRFFVTAKNGSSPLGGIIAADTLKEPTSSTTFVRTLNIAALSSGNYYLQAELKDASGTIVATSKIFFQTINKNPVIANVPRDTTTEPEKVTIFDLSKTFIAKYNTAQLRAILKMITPIASPDEMLAINGFLKKPDEMYSRYFIYNFFTHRYGDGNKGWKLYSDTVRIVNKLFSSGNILGYETDRGYIYLKYGPPAERIPVPNEAGALPYEIWTYKNTIRSNDEGIFLFYQPGFAVGSMVLLHSTVTGERRNGEWRRTLYNGGKPSGNANSRAEEYIGNR